MQAEHTEQKPGRQAMERDPARQVFLEEVLEGLAQATPALPCKYFYDERGSRLFSRICELEEYYPTRIESQLLASCSAALIGDLPAQTVVLEPGAGDAVKVRHLLAKLPAPRGYLPWDISATVLQDTATRIEEQFPETRVETVSGSFEAIAQVREALRRSYAGWSRLLFFPGSTLGNFEQAEAIELLRHFGTLLESGDRLLLGLDLVKDPQTLVAAYDDAEGVTAEFNRNLLHRINHELGGNFQPEHFEHVALYEAEQTRVAMFLESRQSQQVDIAGRTFCFEPGDRIHTEYSHKFETQRVAPLAHAAGYRLERSEQDRQGWFGLYLLVKQ